MLRQSVLLQIAITTLLTAGLAGAQETQKKAAETPAPRPAEIAAKAAKDQARVLPPGELPPDGRLAKPRSLNDYHPFSPPADLEVWKARSAALREQLLVANGLWPLPERTPLEPVIHGKIDKGDYTIEKVYFQSYPGHYVTGNLYRPKGKEGKKPGILGPHGHWANGRFYEATEQEAKKQVEDKAEQFEPNARYPLQARMASLARMGCVVFHYDMVGVADSKPIGHAVGFEEPDAVLRLQSAMGLQTWNSIRALDFLLGLPDVDSERVGVSGASGGGTQTMLLGALDERPTVAFPAVMVSTAMQGGCVCENCPLLRVGSGNVEFAALFAPKPYGMTGADDWTKEIETKGLPELKQLYKLYGSPDLVMAKAFPQFKHNYNQVSREVMYEWMNRYLGLGLTSVKEKPIEPVPPKELSVYDDKHPQPKDARTAPQLREYLTKASDEQMAKLRPADQESLEKFRAIVGPALAAMIMDRMPKAPEILVKDLGPKRQKGYTIDRLLLGRSQTKPYFAEEAVPTAVYMPANWSGKMVVWVDAEGHAALTEAKTGLPNAEVRSLLDKGIAVLAPDVFLTGEFNPNDKYTPAPPVDPKFAKYSGYLSGYNRSTLANRVHDILTAVGCARYLYGAKTIDLVGFGEAGPWTLLAKAAAGDAVRRTIADGNQFTFTSVKADSDPMLLPGALKYGDLLGLAALCAPDDVYLLNVKQPRGSELKDLARAYEVAGNAKGLTVAPADQPAGAALEWLAR